jgi:hypothetical protein
MRQPARGGHRRSAHAVKKKNLNSLKNEQAWKCGILVLFLLSLILWLSGLTFQNINHKSVLFYLSLGILACDKSYATLITK